MEVVGTPEAAGASTSGAEKLKWPHGMPASIALLATEFALGGESLHPRPLGSAETA